MRHLSGAALETLHTPTFRLNSILYVAFLGLAWTLWQRMPERYPGHLSLGGEVTRWAEGPGEGTPLGGGMPEGER
jgi:hypothetical protein